MELQNQPIRPRSYIAAIVSIGFINLTGCSEHKAYQTPEEEQRNYEEGDRKNQFEHPGGVYNIETTLPVLLIRGGNIEAAEYFSLPNCCSWCDIFYNSPSTGHSFSHWLNNWGFYWG